MSYHGKVEKTMEAESVGLLNHMLQTALNRVREDSKFDIIMFLGIDGRIFASSVPDSLDNRQYSLLNMVKENIPHICSQLTTKNMLLSIQRYELGSMVISGVGDKAFLVFLMTSDLDVANLGPIAKRVLNMSVVVKHLMELKPITVEATRALRSFSGEASLSATPTPVFAEVSTAFEASMPMTCSICSRARSMSAEGRSILLMTGRRSRPPLTAR